MQKGRSHIYLHLLWCLVTNLTGLWQALSRVYVNIVDLLECWDTDDHPRKFNSLRQLSAYTWRENKCFNRAVAKQDKVLRVLMKTLL